MTKHCPENERIKRAYLKRLSVRLSPASVDVAANAIHRFEQWTGCRPFKLFHIEQATAFQQRLADTVSTRGGKPLSKATIAQTLNALRVFFEWLSDQPGYRSRIRRTDGDYFRPSDKDSRIARTPNQRPVPTLEQIESVLQRMPHSTAIERRNRAMIAFTWLTGARDGALVSMKVKHVDLPARAVNQDAREVKVKNSKSQRTTFFPVGGAAERLVREWIAELSTEHLWGGEDPLFPATLIQQGSDHQFRPVGIERRHWRSADAARKIFGDAFQAAQLPRFHPHSFRHALAKFGESVCTTPEQFKAWSQNLGHQNVLTTLSSYGEVSAHRQADIIKALGSRANQRAEANLLFERLAEVIRREITSAAPIAGNGA
jgi:integrase